MSYYPQQYPQQYSYPQQTYPYNQPNLGQYTIPTAPIMQYPQQTYPYNQQTYGQYPNYPPSTTYYSYPQNPSVIPVYKKK